MDQFTSALESTVHRATEFHKLLTKEFLPDTFAYRPWWDSDVRPAIGYSFIKIGLLHLGGLLILAERGAYVSCLALLRPMIEACIRGLWFFYCASDDQIEDLAKARERFRFPIFREMVEAIANDKAGVSAGHLLGSENWKDLCDYTHGGVRLIERFVTVEANSDKAKVHIVEAIRNGTKAAGVTIVLFVQDSGGSRNLVQFVKTLLREYLRDEKSHQLIVEGLKVRLGDEELREHFESEVRSYEQKGDRRHRERYKENPFDE